MGKGSIRGAEDDHDQANEIMDSIRFSAIYWPPFNFYHNRWICEDHPEVQTAVGHLLHSYDRNKYESMARVVDAYNTSVRNDLHSFEGQSL